MKNLARAASTNPISVVCKKPEEFVPAFTLLI
jgi:hypothetical protein